VRAGNVTTFEGEKAYSSRCAQHILGSREHEALWVSTEELAEFNRCVPGKIHGIEAYLGKDLIGHIAEYPPISNPTGKDATQQYFLFTEGRREIPVMSGGEESPPSH
jgi:hypothetical protein